MYTAVRSIETFKRPSPFRLSTMAKTALTARTRAAPSPAQPHSPSTTPPKTQGNRFVFQPCRCDLIIVPSRHAEHILVEADYASVRRRLREQVRGD